MICGKVLTATGAAANICWQSLDQSLNRYGTGLCGIFYHHRMDPETPLEETMGASATAVCQGKALYVGLSNYDGETLEQAAAILKDLKCPFVINQNRYSIFDRTVEKNGLKDMTGKLEKGFITFSPLAQGQLTDRLSQWNTGRQPHPKRRKIFERKCAYGKAYGTDP